MPNGLNVVDSSLSCLWKASSSLEWSKKMGSGVGRGKKDGKGKDQQETLGRNQIGRGVG